MSEINLKNPKVLQSFIRSQILEGKGEYEIHEEAVVFKALDGSTFIVPGDLGEEVFAKIKKKAKRVKPEKKEDKKPEELTGEPIKVKGKEKDVKAVKKADEVPTM